MGMTLLDAGGPVITSQLLHSRILPYQLPPDFPENSNDSEDVEDEDENIEKCKLGWEET